MIRETEPGQEPQELLSGLEALLFTAVEPIGEKLLARLLECHPPQVRAALETLSHEYAGTLGGRESAFELRQVAGGWRLYTRPRWAPLVRELATTAPEGRLSQAALETLAIIAYRQPVARTSIASIRGVNADSVTRTLLHRGLIDETGTDPQTGATLYSTTSQFLETIGVNSIDELPPIAPHLPGTDSVDNIPESRIDGPATEDTTHE